MLWGRQDLDSNQARLEKIKEKIEELEEIVQASNERRNLEEKASNLLKGWSSASNWFRADRLDPV